MKKLFDLFWVFALLSVLAVGGGTPILPEMQHMAVEHFGWITDRQFRDIYSIGQVAPGPNMLMVLLIGYRLSGALGVIVVTIAFFLPDYVITLVANRLWERYRNSPWRASVQHGLAPIVIGLMLSGTWAVARLSVHNVVAAAVAVSVFGILLYRHVNPGVIIVLGGLIYMLVPH